MMGSSGPKISSFITLDSSVTSLNTVGAARVQEAKSQFKNIDTASHTKQDTGSEVLHAVLSLNLMITTLIYDTLLTTTAIIYEQVTIFSEPTLNLTILKPVCWRSALSRLSHVVTDYSVSSTTL